MDVEDLIATMHVGKEGQDLKALQAQLARTIRYNPEQIAVYQPVHGIHYVPPPPVSSLNSVASTSYGNYPSSFHPYPPHPNISTERIVRPQCTPAHSYRGFQPSTVQRAANDMDVEHDPVPDIAPLYQDFTTNDRQGRTSYTNGGSSTASYGYDERNHDDDFTAFSSDAFAPLCSGNSYSPPDVWGKAQSQGVFTRGGPTDMRYDGAMDQYHQAKAELDGSGSPMPTEEVRTELDTNWTGRLRDTKARSKRRSPDRCRNRNA